MNSNTRFYNIITNPEPERSLTGSDLIIGQIAIVTATDSTYEGAILLRTYNGLVNLLNPDKTWGQKCTLKVKLLPPGTKIELIIK